MIRTKDKDKGSNLLTHKVKISTIKPHMTEIANQGNHNYYTNIHTRHLIKSKVQSIIVFTCVAEFLISFEAWAKLAQQ